MELRGVVNECYILQDSLGEDSQCEIVRASAMFAATRFMLRFFKPGIPSEGIEAFRALTLAAYSVHHQAIIDVVEMDRSGDRYFVSSEYRSQTSLRAILAGSPSFPLEHVCRFVLELAQGLDAFHQRGIAYGTLDAEAVWVGREAGVINELRFLKPGYLPLLPWLDRSDAASALERFGYLAPEVKGVDNRPVDARSDIYSLGVHLYRFLTGLLPFRGQSARRALDKAVSVLHVANALTRRDVPRELIRIVLTCLRRNPRQRYASVVDLIVDLRGFLDARREASALSGLSDPLEALSTLNEGRKKVGAEQFVRTLETAEYFKALIDSTPRPGEGPAPSPRYPAMFLPTDAAEATRLLELEELESDGLDDDEALDIEALLDRSRALVEAERAAKTAPEPGRSDASTPQAGRSEKSEGMRLVPSAPDWRAEPEPQEAQAVPTEKPAAWRQGTSGAAARPAAVIEWRKELVRLDAAAASLLDAFEGARRGRGAFRFVELPGESQAVAVVRRALDLMAESAFLVDAGSCSGDGRLFAPRVIASIRRFVEERPGRERGRLRVRLAELEAILRIPEAHAIGGESGDFAALGASAAALAAFGRRGRPLVLVAGDAEMADRSLHAFLLRLASLAAGKPLLVLMFHERGKAPAWHVLGNAQDMPEQR